MKRLNWRFPRIVQIFIPKRCCNHILPLLLCTLSKLPSTMWGVVGGGAHFASNYFTFRGSRSIIDVDHVPLSISFERLHSQKFYLGAKWTWHIFEHRMAILVTKQGNLLWKKKLFENRHRKALISFQSSCRKISKLQEFFKWHGLIFNMVLLLQLFSTQRHLFRKKFFVNRRSNGFDSL